MARKWSPSPNQPPGGDVREALDGVERELDDLRQALKQQFDATRALLEASRRLDRTRRAHDEAMGPSQAARRRPRAK